MFSIEQSWRPDDRAPDWQRIRILAQPDGRVLADLPLFELATGPEFRAPGIALLPLRHRYGRQVQVAVDVAAGTFKLDEAEIAQPLGQLAERLAELTAPPKPVPASPASQGTLLDLSSAIGGSILVTGGLLLILIGSNDQSRWMGLAGVAFFGACAVVSMLGLQRRWPRLMPHLPLLAAVAEIPWTVGLLALVLFIIGDAPAAIGRSQVRVMTAAAIVPATFGLLWALVAGIRRPSLSLAGRTSLALGGLICSVLILWFVWQVYE